METTINAEKSQTLFVTRQENRAFDQRKMPKFIQDRPLKLKCYLRTLEILVFTFEILRVSKKQNTVTLHAYYSPQ